MSRFIPHIIFPYHHKIDSSIYPFFLASIGHCNKQPNIERKGLDFHEFHWITKGSGIYNLSGESYTLSAGDCLFFKRGYECSYEVAEKDSHYSTSWITFLCGDELFEKHNIGNFKIFKTPSCTERLYNKILKLCENGVSEAKQSVACYEFVVEILDTLARREKDISALIRDYISQNHNRNITLTDVANYINMTPSSLCRYLKKHKEPSYAKQLRDIRISNAMSFLETTDYQAADIGVLCGFESPSYFGKIFKEETGMTPLQYRETLVTR